MSMSIIGAAIIYLIYLNPPIVVAMVFKLETLVRIADNAICFGDMRKTFSIIESLTPAIVIRFSPPAHGHISLFIRGF
jgi:hypothetical protein